MLDIFDIFLVGGIFCGFITSLLLFFQARRYQPHTNRLLSLAIFPMAWYAFAYLIIKTGAIAQVPALFRAGSPLYYLIGPCAYLYARSVIMDESRLRKWDWLHFLPAILHFIELIPFYLADAETKRQVIRDITLRFNNSYQKGSGLIPAIWHFMFRPVHALIYIACQWVLIIRALDRRKRYTIRGHVFVGIRTWLFSITGLLTVIMLGLLAQSVIGGRVARSSVPVTAASGHMQVIITFAFFAVSAYLFFKPDILYGTLKTNMIFSDRAFTPLPQPANPQPVLLQSATDAEPVEISLPAGEEAIRKETLLDEALIKVYSDKIEAHLLTHQSFRTQGLSINQLADELSIPVHHLSYVLNHHYRLRFNDFINQYRVEYVRQLFKEEGSQSMKLETLAAEAGFSSRSNFFAVFKKITGLTPADYIRRADA